MKLKLILIPLYAFFITFSAFSNASSVDELNFYIEKCYEETQNTEATGSTRPCRDVIKSRITNKENKAVAFHNLGIIHKQSGRTQQALKSFKMALRYLPDSTMTMLAMAEVYQSTNKLERALESIERVLTIDSNNLLAHKMKNAINEKYTHRKNDRATASVTSSDKGKVAD